MELDKETFEAIIETRNDIKYIKEALLKGQTTFLDHERRISAVELEQQYLKGKLATIFIITGGAVTLLINVFWKLWEVATR